MTVWCRQCSKDVSYVPSDEQCWSTVGIQYGANSVLKTSPTSVQTNNVGVLQGANSKHQQVEKQGNTTARQQTNRKGVRRPR